MIKIAGALADLSSLTNQYPAESIEREIIEKMALSSNTYEYATENEFRFEVDLRKYIVKAAVDLDHSDMEFRVFKKSKCNKDYWMRTKQGGFLLEKGVNPSDAIRDIYENSSQYGTECSTAMLIVYYKALLDVLPEPVFNKLFSEIYLYNWAYVDSDFGLSDYKNAADNLPGDGRYFKNPDVDPETPEWQGENVFYLGDGYYYGHGIGIKTAEGMINSLNKHRIHHSQNSAYLLDWVKRLDFKNLAHLAGV